MNLTWIAGAFLILGQCCYSYVLVTADLDDVKKIARRFVSEDAVDKLADFLQMFSVGEDTLKLENNEPGEKLRNLIEKFKATTKKTKNHFDEHENSAKSYMNRAMILEPTGQTAVPTEDPNVIMDRILNSTKPHRYGLTHLEKDNKQESKTQHSEKSQPPKNKKRTNKEILSGMNQEEKTDLRQSQTFRNKNSHQQNRQHKIKEEKNPVSQQFHLSGEQHHKNKKILSGMNQEKKTALRQSQTYYNKNSHQQNRQHKIKKEKNPVSQQFHLSGEQHHKNKEILSGMNQEKKTELRQSQTYRNKNGHQQNRHHKIKEEKKPVSRQFDLKEYYYSMSKSNNRNVGNTNNYENSDSSFNSDYQEFHPKTDESHNNSALLPFGIEMLSEEEMYYNPFLHLVSNNSEDTEHTKIFVSGSEGDQNSLTPEEIFYNPYIHLIKNNSDTENTKNYVSGSEGDQWMAEDGAFSSGSEVESQPEYSTYEKNYLRTNNDGWHGNGEDNKDVKENTQEDRVSEENEKIIKKHQYSKQNKYGMDVSVNSGSQEKDQVQDVQVQPKKKLMRSQKESSSFETVQLPLNDVRQGKGKDNIHVKENTQEDSDSEENGKIIKEHQVNREKSEEEYSGSTEQERFQDMQVQPKQATVQETNESAPFRLNKGSKKNIVRTRPESPSIEIDQLTLMTNNDGDHGNGKGSDSNGDGRDTYLDISGKVHLNIPNIKNFLNKGSDMDGGVEKDARRSASPNMKPVGKEQVEGQKNEAKETEKGRE